MYSDELLNLDNISLKEHNSFTKSILSTEVPCQNYHYTTLALYCKKKSRNV